MREHQHVNHGESGSIKNDRSYIAKVDPIGLCKIDACTNDCGEHDENGRQIDTVPDGRKSDQGSRRAKNKKWFCPKGLQPKQGDRRSHQDRDGIEARDFLWLRTPNQNVRLNASDEFHLHLFSFVTVGVTVQMALDKGEDGRNDCQLNRNLKQDVREEFRKANGLADPADGIRWTDPA